MEKKTFNFYKLRVIELAERLNEIVQQIRESNDPLTTVTAHKKLERERKQAEIWKGKMDEYGSGKIVHVTGDYFKSTGDAENPSFMRMKFEMFFGCETIEDARDVFFSQVCLKYKFDEDSVKFNTIQLKSLYIT